MIKKGSVRCMSEMFLNFVSIYFYIILIYYIPPLFYVSFNFSPIKLCMVFILVLHAMDERTVRIQ